MTKQYVAMMIGLAALAGTTVGAADAPKPDAPKTETPAPAVPGITPKIKFDQLVVDFGTTGAVQSVSGIFTFQNAGDGELKLQKPAPSCGCTVASVKPENLTLKPGEKGEIGFTVNVGHARGHLEKFITVTSNDALTPSTRLTIKADIKQVIEYTPPQVNLGDFRIGTITNFVVDVKRVDGKKLVITKVDPPNKSYRVKIEPVENSEDKARLLIEVEGEGAQRHFADTISGFTDDSPTQPSIALLVFGRLIGDIAVTPEQLFWSITDREQFPGPRPELLTTRWVTISSTQSQKPLELTKLSSTLKDVSLEVQTLEKGKSFKLVAKLAAAPTESERGEITFETNLPSQPKVTVPVTINVLKR